MGCHLASFPNKFNSQQDLSWHPYSSTFLHRELQKKFKLEGKEPELHIFTSVQVIFWWRPNISCTSYCNWSLAAAWHKLLWGHRSCPVWKNEIQEMQKIRTDLLSLQNGNKIIKSSTLQRYWEESFTNICIMYCNAIHNRCPRCYSETSVVHFPCKQALSVPIFLWEIWKKKKKEAQ